MAISGTGPVPPVVLAGPASSDLEAVTLDAVPGDAWRVAGKSAGSAARALANPTPAVAARSGARAPAHDLSWFERVHVIPRRVDLAFVISERTVAVEVWNAFRAAARVLTGIPITGAAGVSIDSPPTLPLHVPATDSRLYTVRASTLGDPTIANTVTWLIAGIDPAGTDLVLTGSRLVPFPFAADARERLGETIAYLTEVLEAESGAEQRRQLREWPRRTFSFVVTLPEARHAQHASALLYGWADGIFGVPLWHYGGRPTAAIGAGATSLPLETADLPFLAGGFALLWRDPFTWEAVTIDSVGPSALTLTSPTIAAWPAAGTIVLPLGIGRLAAGSQLDWPTLDVGVTRVTFDLDASA